MTRRSIIRPSIFVASLWFLVLVSGDLAATQFANPDPFTLADDDESELFVHAGGALSLLLLREIDVFFGILPIGGVPVPLFASDDLPGTSVLINFDVGIVETVGSGELRLFTPTPPPGPLAFYFALPSTVPGDDPLLITSVADVNPDGVDLIGTFRLLSDPTIYSVFLYLPVGASLEPVAMALFSGVDGLSAPVPLPAPLGLLALGTAAALAHRRKTA